ncbi:MAG: tetratricopeptide repeat protein [Gemmatimonadaceae bacterium]
MTTLLADLYCPVTAKAAAADLERVQREIPEISEKIRAELSSACMAELIHSRPKDPQAYLSRFQFRKKWGYGGASDDLQLALQLGPSDLLVLIVAAEAARNESKEIIEAGGSRDDANRQLEIAAKFYKQIIEKKLADDPSIHVALGEVLVDLGEKDRAVAIWQAGLKIFKQTRESLHEHLADLHLQMGQLAEAEQVLAALDEASSPQSHEARLLFERNQQLRRGFWRLRRGESRLAIGHLQQVILRQEQLGGDSPQSTKAWLLLGTAYANLREWVESATAFDRAGTQQPNLALAHLSASASWLAANRVDLAVDRAEVGVRLQPTSQAWFTLAKASFQQQLLLPAEERVSGRLEQAIAEATQRIDDGTMEEPWRIILLEADFLVSKGTDSTAEKEGRQKAIGALERAEAKFPAAKEFWRTLPLAYQRLGQETLADRSWKQFSQLPGAAAEAPLIRARLFGLREQYDLAEKTLTESLTSTAQSDPVAVQREQIEIKVARRDFPAARKLLITLHEAFPRDVSALIRLAEIDLENGSPNALAEVQKKWEPRLAQCDGDGEASSRYVKIRRLLLQAKSAADPLLTQASEEQTKLSRARPTSSQVIALGGLIEQRRGRFAEAISAYEQAISLGDQRISVFEQLISLLENANRSADAAKYLTRMKPFAPLSQELTAAESTLEIRRNQPAQAVAAARRGVERRPQDAAAYVWLGRMLLFNKQQAEAEQKFEQAVKLQPDALQPWNGLFAYYLQTKNLDKARETLARLETNVKLPGDQRSYVLAQLYEQLGDDKQAAVHYQSAKLAASNNPAILVRLAGFYLSTDLEEAERCVTKALEIDPRSSEARRTLALILATRGKDEDWNRAAELLNTDNPGELPSAQNSRLHAFLLAQRGGRNHLEQAIKILEELVARTDNSGVEDRLMLAQFYENMARISLDRLDAATAQTRTPEQNLALCRDQYIAICARTEPQAAHLIAFVDYLLRQNQKEDAAIWLGKLSEVLASNPAPALDSLAQCIRLKLAMGDSAGAEVLQVSLEKAAPDALPTITLRARLMTEQGKSTEVEEYVEAAAERLLKEIRDNRRRAAVYRGLGGLYLSTKQLPLAEKWFRRLYEQQSNQFDSLVGVLAQQGRISEALEICEKNDTQAASVAALAAISVLAGGKAVNAESQRAERLIAAALSRELKDSRLRVELGALRVQQGRTDEAVKLFRDAVNLDQRNVVALNNLATLLSERPDQRKEALKWIDQAIAISGTQPALFDTKATILIFEGRPKEAVNFLKAAVDSSDTDPRYRFHLSLAYKDLNNLAQAKIELQLALQKDLVKQILTPTEQDLLAKLRSMFSL